MKNKFIVFLILGLLFINPIQTLAQAPNDTPVPILEIGDNEALVSFQALGYADDELISPYDSTRVRFGTPPNWTLVDGAELTLNYDLFISGSDVGLAETQAEYTGFLSITFNGNLIGNVYLNEAGSHTEKIKIPFDALVSTRQDGRNELEILLNASLSCVYDIRTNVVVKSTSTFFMPFEISPPKLDLSLLPYPFYMRDSLVPDSTLLVVPNSPAAGELQAALNVAAGFGSMTDVEFGFDLVSVGQLTEEMLASSNLIVVGLPEQFDLLSDIQFPLAVSSGNFVDLPENSSEDGIIQLAPSPWNQNKTILLVSGTTVEAVNKAAKAVSTGKIFTNPDPRLVYVAYINPFVDTLPIVEDFSLKDLGYASENITGIGTSDMLYTFYIAKEQVTSKDAFLDLIFTHSGLLDYNVSTLAVDLNGQTIASASLSEESKNLTTLRVDFPTGLLRFGENRLTVSVNLLPYTSCDTTGFSEYWITIFEDSQIHIPVGPSSEAMSHQGLDFQSYPGLFLGYSNLGNLAYILPESDPNAWNSAAEIAFNLGDLANPVISEMLVSFAGNVPQEILDTNSLIVVGLPSELPIMADLNDSLPAPFDFASNTASERLLQITYRVPADVNVGYLELVLSPYNSDNPILIVAGNSDLGVGLAGNALSTAGLRQQLAGVFAMTNGTQVVSNTQSQFGIVGQISIVKTVVPQAEVVVTTPLPPALPGNQLVSLAKPSWLLPVIIASMILLILIIAYILIAGVFNKRPS